MSILSEMISSMEKSKQSLAQLSSLHLHLQQQQQPTLSSQREERRRSSSAPRSRNSRKSEENYDRWASPATSTAGQRFQHQHEHQNQGSVGSHSPDDEVKDEEEDDFYNSSPFLELGRSKGESANQMLSFDDLAPLGGFAEKQRRHEDVLPAAANSPSGLRSSRKEAKWFPDGTGVMGAGASLNAQYAQEKPPSDFSPWNKQLAASATQEPLDPVSNLQTQLSGAADTQRRTMNQAHSIAATPAPRAELQSQQFSYNRAGYVWEGVRYNRAQGPVVRLCLAQGPLIKVT